MAEANATEAAALDAAVQTALQTGPFSDALRIAIVRSKLTLENLQNRLETRDIFISASTLSYWQKGLRRPEREKSLAALGVLEGILNVPTGGLTALLGPPKPRGRWINYRAGEMDWNEMWNLSDDIKGLVNTDRRRLSNRLQDISLTESFQMGPDRRMQWLQVNTVTQALQTGADRMLLLYNADPDMDVSRVTLTDLEDCRIGRYRFNVAAGFVVFEVLFDQELDQGETFVYGFRVNFADAFLTEEGLKDRGMAPFEANEGVRAFRTQSKAYVMRAHFDPGALPVQCYYTRSGRTTEREHDVAEVRLSVRGSAHIALQDVAPGVHGIRWDWR